MQILFIVDHRNMRTHPAIDALSARSRQRRRCFFPRTNAERKAVAVRVRAGLIVRPHRNLYSCAQYWDTLDPKERSRHIIRALSLQYPNRVFAGLSAAAMLQLDYAWSLHCGDRVFIASSSAIVAKRTYPLIRRIYMASIPAYPIDESDTTVCVTSPARTLVDCGLRYPFEQVLPMVDSALRMGLVTGDEIADVCDSLYVDCGPVLRLTRYADPLSENGGESFCRATIIEEGFAVPELQRVFTDARTGSQYRVDFLWRLSDGRIVVLEYDGMRKYVDPAMTGSRDIRDVVRAERERETALRQCGVSMMLRTDFEEVRQRVPLTAKLLAAGVPQVRHV
ncbi:CTP synthase [Bifidobacterium simiiventris]|uniref:CTP synthase n=1 Tax=Bifidobacterium simiiventris TaxID=2834434 RepID=UPI003083FB3C